MTLAQAVPAVDQPLSRRIAATAVTLMFAVNGMLLGGYGGVLPSLKVRLHLSTTEIAAMLLASGVAAILSMQVGGRLADAIGARRVALVALPIVVLALVVIAQAHAFAVAVVGSTLIGLGNGAMDVAMNALAVQVEKARRRPIMSFFHAFFSVGNFAGAGTVLLISLAFGLSGTAVITPVLVSLAVLGVLVLILLLRISPEAAVVTHTVDGVRSKIPKAAYLIGLMAIAFGLAEGTAVDWSSLHVTEVAHVDTTTGSLGLVAVSGFMVVIRLLGDRLVSRFGRRAVIRFGGVCASLGYLAVTLVGTLPLLVAGWALVGFGVGMIAPQVYALAGHMGGGRVLALVTTFGYAAFLAGPGVVGFCVNRLGIHHAMAVPAVLGVLVVLLAVVLPREDHDLT